MPEKPNKTQAEVPYSMLEYTAVFTKPIIEAAAVPATLITAVLKALEPSGLKLEGVEAKTATEKLADSSPDYASLPKAHA